jgi:hypothetical protein
LLLYTESDPAGNTCKAKENRYDEDSEQRRESTEEIENAGMKKCRNERTQERERRKEDMQNKR